MMKYKSTRSSIEVSPSEAILKGLADDGGLFVPVKIPKIDVPFTQLAQMQYGEIAYEILKLFLDDYSSEDLKYCIFHAYDQKFDTEEIAPLVKKGDAYYLELFHGKTIAFKDMALSILPYLMTTAARMNHLKEEIVILTATSGDTGKAALAGFAGVDRTKIIVFYPKDGVSEIQKKQMVTQAEDNTLVVGVNGNFDDCQTAVKNIFHDPGFRQELQEKGYVFSSANSINVGRLVPQIVYYVYAYVTLVKRGAIQSGQEINFVVPTGNFGNILAAYYAKEAGLPIHKLICASNENRVLYDFFSTGVYDKNRKFFLTNSPSMDILVSSNLERLIYHITGNDAAETARLMASLQTEGRYEITSEMREKLRTFYGAYAGEQETLHAISALYHACHYVQDTHTAVASAAYEKYLRKVADERPTVIVSTASPYKFAPAVMKAIAGNTEGDVYQKIDALHQLSGVAVPKAVSEIQNAPVRHKQVCEAGEMKNCVRKFLRMDQ